MNNNNVKSATVAGLLGIFLGSIGAHDWYLGDKKKGLIHVCLAASGIVVSIISSFFIPTKLSYSSLLATAGIATILSGISSLIMFGNGVWGFIEGVMILSQGDAGLAKKGYKVQAQPNPNNFNNNNNLNNFNHNSTTQNNQNNQNGQNNQQGGFYGQQ